MTQALVTNAGAAPVTVLNTRYILGEATTVTRHSVTPGHAYTLHAGEDILATSTSGRELSRYAFAHGAQSVAHRYDLRMDDDV